MDSPFFLAPFTERVGPADWSPWRLSHRVSRSDLFRYTDQSKSVLLRACSFFQIMAAFRHEREMLMPHIP